MPFIADTFHLEAEPEVDFEFFKIDLCRPCDPYRVYRGLSQRAKEHLQKYEPEPKNPFDKFYSFAFDVSIDPISWGWTEREIPVPEDFIT